MHVVAELAGLDDELAAMDSLEADEEGLAGAASTGTAAALPPSYLSSPTMPAEPSSIPSAGGGRQSVDEYGLPMAPSGAGARPAQEMKV